MQFHQQHERRNDPETLPPPVRLVVLLSGGDLRQWHASCLETVRHLTGCAVVGIVRGVADAASPAEQFRRRLRTLTLPDAMRRCELPAWLSDIDSRVCAVSTIEGREIFADADIDWIQSLRPTLIVKLGFGIIGGKILTVASQGVWSFHHGDIEKYRGHPPVFWEMLNDEMRVGVTLLRLTKTLDESHIVARAFVPVIPGSPRRTVQSLYQCAPLLFRRALLELREEGSVSAFRSAELGQLYGSPHFADLLRFVWAITARLSRWFVERAFYEHGWRIGKLTPAPPLGGESELDPQWIAGPKRGFFADPCPALDDDGLLLVEHYEDARRKGKICAVRLADAPPAICRPILDLPCHLSFPQLYRVDDRIWLIPETHACGAQLAFELDASLAPIASDGPVSIEGLMGVDPALFMHQGRWWALASPGGRTSHHLNVYYATNFLGPYAPHAANPIVIDPFGARPAGPVIEHEGRLIRFGQIQGRRYGEGIAVFEITMLTPVVYKERQIGLLRLKGPRGRSGTHGIALFPWGTVVDGYELRFSWAVGVRKLQARLQSARRQK